VSESADVGEDVHVFDRARVKANVEARALAAWHALRIGADASGGRRHAGHGRAHGGGSGDSGHFGAGASCA
jgi:hypothetical protein